MIKAIPFLAILLSAAATASPNMSSYEDRFSLKYHTIKQTDVAFSGYPGFLVDIGLLVNPTTYVTASGGRYFNSDSDYRQDDKFDWFSSEIQISHLNYVNRWFGSYYGYGINAQKHITTNPEWFFNPHAEVGALFSFSPTSSITTSARLTTDYEGRVMGQYRLAIFAAFSRDLDMGIEWGFNNKEHSISFSFQFTK